MNNHCFCCLRKLTTASQRSSLGDFHNSCVKFVFGEANLPTTLLSRKDVLLPEVHLEKNRRMSISGVQPKLSLFINQKNELEPTPTGGTFILKPSPEQYPEASEGEQLGMLAAADAGVRVPPSALIRLTDGNLAYLVRRFDRNLKGEKILQVEDLTQILNIARDENGDFKYSGSYEIAFQKAREATGGRASTSAELFQQLVLSFVFGNGDLHLKNFSLVSTEHKGRSIFYERSSPAYDILPTFLWVPLEAELALMLLEDKNGTDRTPAYEALGFHSQADFLELGKRLMLPEKTCLKYIANAVKSVQETSLLAMASQVLSADFLRRFVAETEDRMKKINTILKVKEH